MPFTSHNDAKLLINGREAFPAMFAGMEAAKAYIIVQFYIIRDDTLGRQLKEILARKAREGVRVYVLFDEIGSYHLPRAYRRELAEAGVVILPFQTSRGMRNRFQINFRNHRKIVIADGHVAYVGGFNVGDEYMGRHPKFGPWRDTAVEVRGPVVQAIQFTFLEDWYWATGDVPDLDWSPLPLPTTPTRPRSASPPTRPTCSKRAACSSCTRSIRLASESGSRARISCPIRR